MSAAVPPQVSVVIACLDAQDVLGGQLAALAAQRTDVPFEVLVCDNGSRDRTVEVARAWVGRLPLRVVDASAVRGSGPARNVGAAQAVGPWLAFCDADDEVDGGWLTALAGGLAEHPVVAGRLDGERLNPPRVRRTRPLDQQSGLQLCSPEVGLPHASAGNLGVRRDAFMAVGGFDPGVRYLQDTDLCWRLQLAGYPLVFVPDAVVHTRLRATLPLMYRQGRNWGAAQARLERRYLAAVGRGRSGVFQGGEPRRVAAGGGQARSRLGRAGRQGLRAMRGGARLLSGLVTRRAPFGEQVWQLGWHVGHFLGR